MNFHKLNFNKGYSVVEIVVYIALFAILSITVTNSLLVMVKAFSATAVEADFLTNANVMERMTREIRKATEVNVVSSSDIQLTSANSAEFKLLNGNLQLIENGTLTGNLNAPNIVVSSLDFVLIATPVGKAIKIEISVTDTKDKNGRTESFYGTVSLRGKY